MEKQYNYKYILRPAVCMKNNNIITIADELNRYAAQGYRVINITHFEDTNQYACILEKETYDINRNKNLDDK